MSAEPKTIATVFLETIDEKLTTHESRKSFKIHRKKMKVKQFLLLLPVLLLTISGFIMLLMLLHLV